MCCGECAVSRAAEEEFKAQFAKHLEECARDLVVGATVYRAAWDGIEEGVVRRVSKCYFGFGGSGPYEDEEKGTSPLYVAQFRSDWVEQTYQWRWFFDPAKAREELVRELRLRIENNRRAIARWEALIEQMGAEVWPEHAVRLAPALVATTHIAEPGRPCPPAKFDPAPGASPHGDAAFPVAPDAGSSVARSALGENDP